MDELADRPEPGEMSAIIKGARLQSLLESLPDAPRATSTVAIVARRLRSRPEWRGSMGQRLTLEFVEKAVGKLVEAHPDLIKSETKINLRGFPELRIWRRRSRPVPNR